MVHWNRKLVPNAHEYFKASFVHLACLEFEIFTKKCQKLSAILCLNLISLSHPITYSTACLFIYKRFRDLSSSGVHRQSNLDKMYIFNNLEEQ